MGEYSMPELEYLKDNEWIFTEKVDGTNIRVDWNPEEGLMYGGKTDKAQMPPTLLVRLREMFSDVLFFELYPDTPMTLYGEGYGVKIQAAGKNYKPDGVDFVLFDIKIGRWYLKREDIFKIANTLNLELVPVVGCGTLEDGIKLVTSGLKSCWGDFEAEGIVCKPKIDLSARSGMRIVTKIKHKDFK